MQSFHLSLAQYKDLFFQQLMECNIIDNSVNKGLREIQQMT